MQAADQIKIPSILVTKVLKFALHMQVDIRPILTEMNFDPSLENIYTESIDFDLFFKLIQNFTEQHPMGGIGLQFGDSFAFEYLPEMETFLSTAHTPKQALEIFHWAVPLLIPFAQFEIQQQEQRLALVIQLHEAVPNSIRPLITEAVFSVIFKFARLLIGDDFQPLLLELQHPLQSSATDYEHKLKTKIRANSVGNKLWVDEKLLNNDLKNSMPQLHEQAADLLQSRLESISTPESLARQIYHLMHEDAKYRNAHIDVFAELKNVTTRTIQRQLHKEETSFREITDKVKLSLACQWLRQPEPSIDAIGEELGFSDRRSFTRSFSRWMQQSPSAYRKRFSNN